MTPFLFRKGLFGESLPSVRRAQRRGGTPKRDANALRKAASVHDVYFSFGTMPSGRAAVVDVDRQLDDLGRLADSGIALNILFNANCYGARAESKELFGEIGEALDRFSEGGALESVTTTSPLVARFVKENFPELKTRASVNMEIGTIEGMEYLADRFDGYYVKRELNRDLAAFAELKKWADANGKELFMLANSGCLNHCSSHIFHDNLVAHEAEIAKEDNGYAYRGTCWEYLKRETDKAKIAARWNWVRPEDIHRYEGLVAAARRRPASPRTIPSSSCCRRRRASSASPSASCAARTAGRRRARPTTSTRRWPSRTWRRRSCRSRSCGSRTCWRRRVSWQVPSAGTRRSCRRTTGPNLCDKCGECAKGCPGRAIDAATGRRDDWRCSAYYNGANGLKNPFMPPDAFADFPDRLKIIAGEAEMDEEKAKRIIDHIWFYPPAQHSYPCSICGRACDTACYRHLEAKGVLKRKFKHPFRTREEWTFKLSDFQ